MEGSAKGDVAGALLEGPLDRLIVEDPNDVEIVLGKEILGVVESFRFLQAAEHVVSLADGDDGVTRSGRGSAPGLFDLLPSDGRGHSNN